MAVKKTDVMDRLAKVGPKAVAAARDSKRARPEGLSVGDVAQRLGITKAEVRALLQRPEFAARTQARIASDGAAPQPGRVIVPEDLFADLSVALASGPPQPAAAPSSVQQEPSEPERGTYPNHPGPEMSLAIVYERLLAEKDERIADLRAEIEHLRGVLDREQSGHARTQTLLSLQAPPPAEAQPADSDAPDEASAPVEAPDPAADPPPTEVPVLTPAAKAEQIVQATAKRPFWQFWRRD